jgi:hydrogenase expression/formation protein HypE
LQDSFTSIERIVQTHQLPFQHGEVFRGEKSLGQKTLESPSAEYDVAVGLGIGRVEHQCTISPAEVRPGDAVLLSSDIGRHGMAIMSVRECLQFESSIESDCAPLAGLVRSLLDTGIEIHCLRDLTRGGLASALNEIAQCAGAQIDIDQNAVPVHEEVRGACEMLGLDPLYVANEGRFVAFVTASDVDHALKTMRLDKLGADATQIGEVAAGTPGLVTLRSQIGARRILDLLSGEQLSRIC